jgi:hypothetical protein
LASPSAVASGGTVPGDELTGRVAGALKISEADAQARVTELAGRELLQDGGDGPPVQVTDAGQQLYGRIRTGVTEITERLWGDLPDGDLATAGRVLTIVTDRANAELSRAVPAA